MIQSTWHPFLELIVAHMFIQDAQMRMTIKEADSIIWGLSLKYRRALENAGLYDVLQNRPDAAIMHIMNRVSPKTLYRKMKELIAWKCNEGFHMNDYGTFKRQLTKNSQRAE